MSTKWTFEISRQLNAGARGRHGRRYAGDYGAWSAVAATEDMARAIVNAEVPQCPGIQLVAGDLLSVARNGKVLWEEYQDKLTPAERSHAALAAIG
jgi:hypothetical protein